MNRLIVLGAIAPLMLSGCAPAIIGGHLLAQAAPAAAGAATRGQSATAKLGCIVGVSDCSQPASYNADQEILRQRCNDPTIKDEWKTEHCSTPKTSSN